MSKQAAEEWAEWVDEQVLCRDCPHFFDPEMAGNYCPICSLHGDEGKPLPEETVDPADYELDKFGHAVNLMEGRE
jgi:hypothetical protein